MHRGNITHRQGNIATSATRVHIINLLFYAYRKYHSSSRQHCTRVCFTRAVCSLTTRDIQGSPQPGIKAERVGVVWAEFVTTSIDSLPTSKLN